MQSHLFNVMALSNGEFSTKRLNQFGDYEDTTNMSVDDWDFRWAQDQTQFHMPIVHPMLKKHLGSMTLGRDKLKFFLPLCGKSLDIKCLGYFPFQPVVHNWFIKGRGMHCSVYEKVHINDPLLLIEKSSVCGGRGFPSKKRCPGLEKPSIVCSKLLEQGHEVIGCEGVDKGCRDFFKEHDMEYTSHTMNYCEGTVYKATDYPLIMYRCDFFDLKREEVGQFDCVWDRGSFVAIPITERQRYAELIVPLMTDDCKYLLDCFLVDNAKFGGPPFNCSENDVKKYFESTCTVKKTDIRDAFTPWQKSWGITYFVEEIYMIELK